MHYNLRSEIIYYKSGSDFELEFNLCGCCRMRLLTDKPTTKKAFVHSLARAVSRSRVILIAGSIFGEENTIEVVSQALGTTTEIADNKAYNIATDDEIQIIKGSVPLVGQDGSFGGCIIESGPQTMILLTDNKTLRKNIMSNLIHPYIAELYAAEMNSNKETEPQEDNTTEIDDTAVVEENNLEEIKPDEITSTEISIEAEPTPIIEEEEIALVLPIEDEPEIPKGDIKPEDIFIDTSDNEEYEDEKHDISIEDLIPNTDEVSEPLRTIDEKLDESKIVFDLDDDNDDYDNREFPEEYKKAFVDFRLNQPEEDFDDVTPNKNKPEDQFQFLDDEGEIIGERETVFENQKPGIHIATIIVTVILLLSIIVLCFCIFSAATSKDMSPAQYIKDIWATLFS